MKTPFRIFTALLVAFGLIMSEASAVATTWYTTNNVTAGTGDGTSGNPWNPNYAFWQPSVQPGDTIVLKGAASGLTVYTNFIGRWNDQASYWRTGTAPSPITIKAETSAGVIIRPAAGADAPAIFVGSPDSQAGHEAVYLIFQDLHVDGVNIGSPSVNIPNIKVDFGSFIVFTNCTSYNNPSSHGLQIAPPAHNITWTGGEIHDNALLITAGNTPHAIYDGGSWSNTIEKAFIYNHNYTMGGTYSPHAIHKYSGGDAASYDIFRYNVLSNNNRGIGVYAGTNHLVYGNMIIQGSGGIVGIVIQAAKSYYYNNTIKSDQSGSGVQYGILAQGASTGNNLIRNNLICSNRYDGILISSGVQLNTWEFNMESFNAVLGGGNFTDNSGGNQSIGPNFAGNGYLPLLTAAPNYVPTASSSARNTGENNLGYNLDAAGTVVPQETITDIGWKEYNSGGVLPLFSILSASAYAFQAGPINGTVTVGRDDASSTVTLLIQYGGTAVNGSDYTANITNLNFAAGTVTTNITIVPLTATPFAGDKSVTVTLLTNANYTLQNPTNSITLIHGSIEAAAGTSRRAN